MNRRGVIGATVSLSPAASAGQRPCPIRSIRRGHLQGMKAKAAHLWGRRQSSNPRRQLVSARDAKRRIGRMAANHNTHQCFMCRFEKLFNITSIADRRRELYLSDLQIEAEQEQWAEYLSDLSARAEECDEIRDAFGHDIHRGLLMTQYEQSLAQGRGLASAAGKDS